MKVTVANLLDPRLEPDTVAPFAAVQGPLENQYYTLNASSKGNDSITYNNIVTRGASRAYLDTFEQEITATVSFTITRKAPVIPEDTVDYHFTADRIEINSFPLSRCTSNIHINLNGAGLDSSPQQYLRAKERYWSQKKLLDSYGNICPCNKAWMATEFPEVSTNGSISDIAYGNQYRHLPYRILQKPDDMPTGIASLQTQPNGFRNNDCVVSGTGDFANAFGAQDTAKDYSFTFKWREPIFCSPFSSRYDETWGRPLYNITSLDIVYTLQGLGNMFTIRPGLGFQVSGVNVTIQDACLKYQVLSVPPNFPVPPQIAIPYRRLVPYATSVSFSDVNPGAKKHFQSGVYSLNQVPTAIWIFVGPKLSDLQSDNVDVYPGENYYQLAWNKGFAPVSNISISLANTTRILADAAPEDLYRICKTNGCDDSFSCWGRKTYANPRCPVTLGANTLEARTNPGIGSVLRLIPGVDIILPDQKLVPGSNAKDMVFQVEGDWFRPYKMPAAYADCALWILFEYVGVITLAPGSCSVELNPVTPATANITPLASTSGANEQPGTLSGMEGSGFWDKFVSWAKKINDWAKEYKVGSTLAKLVPGIGKPAAEILEYFGYGEPGKKRPRPAPFLPSPVTPPYIKDATGGAVMGLGDFT